MAMYQIHFKANPVLWPSDPKENLAVWENSAEGGRAALESGLLQEIYMVSASEGYCRLESDSKMAALAVAATFFPLFTQEIQELVPWEEAKDVMLEAIRQMAGSE